MFLIDKSFNGKQSIIVDFNTGDYTYKVPVGLKIGEVAALCLDSRATGKLRFVLEALLSLYEDFVVKLIDEPFVSVNKKMVSINTFINQDSVIELV